MQDLVVMGTGQMGRWFGEAALRAGRRIVPVRRGDVARDRIERTGPGTPIVVSVPEGALADTIARIPVARVADAVLVQNGMFASDLAALGLDDATVLAVWTLRKAGQPYIVAQRTGAYGPHAAAIAEILGAHDVDVAVLASKAERDRELVAKYGFILAVNALGFAQNRTVGAWLEADPDVTWRALDDGLAIAATYADGVDPADAVEVARAGLRGFAAMQAAGRSAPARVERAIARADAHGLDVPTVRALSEQGLAARG